MWTDLRSAVMALLRVVFSRLGRAGFARETWAVVDAALRQLGVAWHGLMVVAARVVSRAMLVPGHAAAAVWDLRRVVPQLGRAGLSAAVALAVIAWQKLTWLMRPEEAETEAPAFLELLTPPPVTPVRAPAPAASTVPVAPAVPVAQPVLRAAVGPDPTEAPVVVSATAAVMALKEVASAEEPRAAAYVHAKPGAERAPVIARATAAIRGARVSVGARAAELLGGMRGRVALGKARLAAVRSGLVSASAKAQGLICGGWTSAVAKARGAMPDVLAAVAGVRAEIGRAVRGFWTVVKASGDAGKAARGGREVVGGVRARAKAAARWGWGAGIALGRRVSAAVPGWAGAMRLAAGNIWEATGLQEKGFRIPGGAKAFTGGIAAVAVILSVGFGAAHLNRDEQPVVTMPSPVVSRAAPAPELVQAAAAVPEIVPKMLPLSRFNPVTGPDRPPLPEDANGPQGSLRTTGTYEVALTFDDGPDPRWTPEVLRMLREYNVKATFCVIGVNAIEFPELVRDIDADGHTLCNHSWGHDTGLGNRSYATIVADMQRTNDVIRAAAPRARISYFRHPGGNWTAAAVRAARSLGMTSLHWDVDPRDWLRPGPRAISSMVTGSAIPGSIVLMHDGGGDRRGTADALQSILPNLTSRFPLVALPPGVDPPKLYGIHLPIHAGQE